MHFFVKTEFSARFARGSGRVFIVVEAHPAGALELLSAVELSFPSAGVFRFRGPFFAGEFAVLFRFGNFRFFDLNHHVFHLFAGFERAAADGEAEKADVAAEGVVVIVRIGDQSGFFQPQFAVLVKIFVVDVDGDNFRQEHVVTAVVGDADHFALD